MSLEMIDSSEIAGADFAGVFGGRIGLHDGEQASLARVGDISSGRDPEQWRGISGVRSRGRISIKLGAVATPTNH